MASTAKSDTIPPCKGKTGVVYDDRMAEHRCLWDDNHIENPERFIRIIDRCNELNLFNRCERLESRFGTLDEILLKHTEEQFNILKSTSGLNDSGKLEAISSQYHGIYIHPSTFDLARLAVGSTIELVNNILTKKIQNGMAIIRPPGHHAMKSEYNGFCFFNNVSIAAQHAINVHGLKRILIVDFDVHHGQASQRMFYDDPRVLYFSVHRFEFGSFWPYLRESDFDYIGSGEGRGFNFNIPLNKIGMNNGDYLAIWQQVLIPVATEYQPELIIVSAGYDAAYGCPEGQMEVTPACYAHLLLPLLQLAQGRVAVVLEGGYCLESLSEGAAITLKTLLGDPCPLLDSVPEPSDCIRDTILNSIYAHKSCWNCFQTFKEYDPKELDTNNPQRELHQVVQKFIGETSESYKIHYEQKVYLFHHPNELAKILEHLKKLKDSVNLSFPPNRVCFSYFDHEHIHSESTQSKKFQDTFDAYNLTDRVQKVTVHHRFEELEFEWVRQWFQWQTNKDIAYYLNTPLLTDTVHKILDNVISGDSRCGIGVITGQVKGHIEPNGYITSIAAQIAIRSFDVQRVLIIDWNTSRNSVSQGIFETNPNVLYISINESESAYTLTGKDLGEGLLVNIPWSKDRNSYIEYITAVQKIIMPIGYEFEPDLVLLTGDLFCPEGDIIYKGASQAYMYLISWLSALANGRIVVLLEAISDKFNFNTAAICTKALLGDPILLSDDENTKLSPADVENINNVLDVQDKYWKSLRFNKKLPAQ